ncbi:hypothetical protein FT641_19710 [Bacillus paranthracis]|uniref:hypothetical protein n=1 Tax=Bacillus paranthracis TaxID=2026186 RepID=UPI00187AF751|nr:hypothetical protein [Bacillus paranthracis]MBE7114712.1 hypothetical protein [Bacillus paranthracis]MBE7154921.1 hypothetical protein [Bacillus paranthracis]
MIINGYDLEFRSERRGYEVKKEQAVVIGEALDKLNVIRSRMYFEALGSRFQILDVRKHGTYTHVSFRRVSK